MAEGITALRDEDTTRAPLAEAHDYRGGLMPPAVAARVRELRRASGMSQEEMAGRIGLSRPQLANAEAARFGLSPTAAERLVALLSAIEPEARQMSLLPVLPVQRSPSRACRPARRQCRPAPLLGLSA